MSNAMLNIYVRIVREKMAAGEDPEVVLENYPKLSQTDKKKILDALG